VSFVEIAGEGVFLVEIQKIFVNPKGGTAVLKCPHCGNVKTLCVGKFRGSMRRVKIRCSCQEVFAVVFEFRKNERKEINLRGYYAKPSEGRDWHKTLITNISVGGIGLLAQSIHNLKEGDELKVRFTLPDPTPSVIEKKAVVRWVKDIHLGCEFLQSVAQDDEYEDTALINFYLGRQWFNCPRYA
jgi:hypothetical protein